MGNLSANENADAWLRVLFDGTMDAAVLTDATGQILEWNQQADAVFGWSRAEALQADIDELLTPHDAPTSFREAVTSTQAATVADGDPLPATVTLRRKTGEQFPAMLKTTKIPLPGHAAAIHFIRDMTEHFAREHNLVRQKLEKELLLQAATLTTEKDSLEEALRICVNTLCRVTGWPVGHVYLPSPDANRLESSPIWFIEDSSFESLRAATGDSMAPPDGFAQRVLSVGEPLWTSDLQNEPYAEQMLERVGLSSCSAFGFPVRIDEEIIAVLEFFSPRNATPDPQALQLARTIGDQLGGMLKHRRQQEEQTRHAAIVNSTSDAIIGRSLEGTITSWNEGAVALYGYSAEEAVAGGMQLILPDDCAAEFEDVLRRVRSGQHVDRTETRRRRKDGSEVYVSITVSPVFDDKGTVLGSSAIERDITDLVQAQRELRESEEHTRLLLDSAAEAIYGIDRQGNCTFCNRACLQILGYASADDLLGCNMHELLHHTREDGSEYPREECPIYHAVRHGEETHVDHEILWRRDGRFFPAEYWSYPIVRRGETVGAVVTFLDISDRIEAEEGRARLASVVDSSVDAIIATDPDGNITNWNRGAELIYGYSRDEALGNSLSLLLPPDQPLEASIAWQAIQRRGELRQYETIRARRNGEIFDVSITLSPIQTADGRFVGASSIDRDITARRRRERELVEARDAAESASRARSEFLANVSHELRTPMNSIIGMTDLALREELSPGVRDCLTTARDSADTLLFLLNDILDFSRMEAGRFELDATEFNLRDMVHDTIKSLSLRAHEKGLELACHIDLDVPYWVTGDPMRLRQIITNLVTNALKFTEHGEVLVRIRLEEELPLRTPGTPFRLHVTVVDTGIGISQEDQARIFAPFTQADASTTRRFQGTGLGLSICSRLTQLMDGRMWVESQPGAGSRFHFTASLSVAAEGDDGVTREREASRQLRALPVLIVDDNQTNRHILSEMLRNWSMQPTACADAEEALSRLDAAARQGAPFPLIIVDALMPEVDGFMLIERIQADPQLQRATILMLSSADRQIFQERCSTLPVTAYLEKPVSQSDLLDAIMTALDGPRVVSQSDETMGRTDRPLQILVAEDTPANQKVIQRILAGRGHRVEIAHNGRDAVEQTEREAFDVVIMDVQMPTMDGLQATATIRTREQSTGRHLPIVAMTAHAMRGDREKCLAAGMDDYLSKPIDADKLIRLVESIAETRTDAPAATAAAGSRPDRLVPESSRSPAPAAVGNDENAVGGANAVEKENMAGQQQAAHDVGPAEDVWDVTATLKRLGNDPSLLNDLIGFFSEDAPGLLTDARAALTTADSAALARAAHSLKGLCASFEATAATTVAAKIQELAQTDNHAPAKPLLDALEHEVTRLQRHLALWQVENS